METAKKLCTDGIVRLLIPATGLLCSFANFVTNTLTAF